MGTKPIQVGKEPTQVVKEPMERAAYIGFEPEHLGEDMGFPTSHATPGSISVKDR